MLRAETDPEERVAFARPHLFRLGPQFNHHKRCDVTTRRLRHELDPGVIGVLVDCQGFAKERNIVVAKVGGASREPAGINPLCLCLTWRRRAIAGRVRESGSIRRFSGGYREPRKGDQRDQRADEQQYSSLRARPFSSSWPHIALPHSLPGIRLVDLCPSAMIADGVSACGRIAALRLGHGAGATGYSSAAYGYLPRRRAVNQGGAVVHQPHEHSEATLASWRDGRRLRARALHQQGWIGTAIAAALCVTRGARRPCLKRAAIDQPLAPARAAGRPAVSPPTSLAGTYTVSSPRSRASVPRADRLGACRSAPIIGWPALAPGSRSPEVQPRGTWSSTSAIAPWLPVSLRRSRQIALVVRWQRAACGG
jgi:hypothetical protein